MLNIKIFLITYLLKYLYINALTQHKDIQLFLIPKQFRQKKDLFPDKCAELFSIHFY